MHLVEAKSGFPFERCINRPIFNFIRAVVLLARGELKLRRGVYIPPPASPSPDVGEPIEYRNVRVIFNGPSDITESELINRGLELIKSDGFRFCGPNGFFVIDDRGSGWVAGNLIVEKSFRDQLDRLGFYERSDDVMSVYT